MKGRRRMKGRRGKVGGTGSRRRGGRRRGYKEEEQEGEGKEGKGGRRGREVGRGGGPLILYKNSITVLQRCRPHIDLFSTI